MYYNKTIILILLSFFISICAWAEGPHYQALAPLRQEIMALNGPAEPDTLRRVLSYRQEGKTLLLLASRQADTALIAQLARVLPDTRVFQAKDEQKRNAFHLAADYNTALELLKTYAKLRGRETSDIGDVFDRRAFKVALINAGDLHGETPLMAQVRARQYEVAFLYLTKNADLNRKNVSGDTALHLLVAQSVADNPRAIALLESFLRGEPYSVFLRDDQGRTPLKLAYELRARVAFEKIKEVESSQRETLARNARIALQNFLNN